MKNTILDSHIESIKAELVKVYDQLLVSNLTVDRYNKLVDTQLNLESTLFMLYQHTKEKKSDRPEKLSIYKVSLN